MIKFVYFDVGGVLISDFSDGTGKWTEMKRIMGVKPEFEKEFDEFYNKYELEELCLTRDVDSLMPIFSKKFDIKFPKGFSMMKYFIDHFDKNTSLWPVIDEAQKKCGIGMLTNMYIGMLEKIKNQKLLPTVAWGVVIDSTVAELQKPDPKIYKLSEEKCGFKGSEILLIDNSQKNLDAAKSFSWQTFLYDPKNTSDSSRRLLNYIKKNV